MAWNFADDQAIWLQLKKQITQRILNGTYPRGSRLPSVRELANEAGVNPNTMQRALSELELDGLAESNRTSGRMVTNDEMKIEQIRKRMALTQVRAYMEQMAQLGYNAEEAAQLVKELWKEEESV